MSLSADPDPYPGEDIEPEIRWRVDSLTAMRADTQFVSASTLKLPAPESYDVAIAALFVRVADRKGNVGLPDDQRAFVNQLLAAGKPCAVVSFGSPYLIERFPNAKTWLAEFSTNDVSQRAAARALFGQTAITGKIPVTVPGTVNRGDGLQVAANPMTLEPAPPSMSDRLKPAFELLDRAVADGAFPGGVLAVGTGDQLVVHPFGKFTRDAKAAAVKADTIYDLASLDETDRHDDGRNDARRSRSGWTSILPSRAICRNLPQRRNLIRILRGAHASRCECSCCTIPGSRRTGISTKMRRATTPFSRA